jgi:hypothetical protein
MAYKDSWLRHLFAPMTGEGLTNALARNFWSREDLWSSEKAARYRWVELVLDYAVSTVAQMMLLLLVAVAMINVFKSLPFERWLIYVGGGTAFAMTLAVLFATTSWIDLYRRSRGQSGCG